MASQEEKNSRKGLLPCFTLLLLIYIYVYTHIHTYYIREPLRSLTRTHKYICMHVHTYTYCTYIKICTSTVVAGKEKDARADNVSSARHSFTLVTSLWGNGEVDR